MPLPFLFGHVLISLQFEAKYEHPSPVPVRSFGALLSFVYTGVMNFTATDCLYLYLYNPGFYRVSVDSDLLTVHWRKRLSSLSGPEVKELEVILQGFDKDTGAAFAASDLTKVLAELLR